MKAPRSKIASVVGDESLKLKSHSKLSKEIAAYLLETNRVSELDSIMRDVSVYWANNGVVEANVVSAFKLSSAVKSDIKDKVKHIYPKAKKIIINEQIDESLISGVKVELPNELIDLSIETKLNKFKQLAVLGKGI